MQPHPPRRFVRPALARLAAAMTLTVGLAAAAAIAAAGADAPPSATPPTPAAPSWTWFEAESGARGSDGELSGGGMVWIGPSQSVERTVRIPADGTYTLWIRKFWNPQGLRWRVGEGGAWTESREQNLADLHLLGGDPGRRIGWANAGRARLNAGTHAFRLEPLSGDANTTAYDCFLLTPDPFTPRGHRKPGEKTVINQPGWLAFEPAPDRFLQSPIDLRGLNEKEAGEGGFIRVRDEAFVHETTGQPARFWGVNVGMNFVGSDPAELEVFARSMAKRGVNVVRVHGPIYATSGPRFGEVNPRRISQLQHFTAILKRQGIYTSLSIYFPLWVSPGPDHPDFPGYTRGQHPFGLPYFSESFQRLYREWWRALLTTPNPHTGLPFKDDPAIAFAEMINEDSTMFWTFNPSEDPRSNLPEPQRALLERRFASWLRTRHPDASSLEDIRTRIWNGVATPHDDLAAGRVGFRPLWEMINRRTPRDQDTVRFLTDLMIDFHRKTYAHLKSDLGYRGLVYASNWKTASPQYLDPLDKHANGIGDFYDRHGYFGGPHEGSNAAWNIEPGQTYDDRSALLFRRPDGKGDDFDNPAFDLIYNRRPSVITEINWPLPNRFRADMVPFTAAYGALQGTDAIHWFAAGSTTWDGLPGKFSIQTPTVLGQFPAAAILYRQGLVRTGPRVVELELDLERLHALEGTPLPAPQNFDTLRSADVPRGGILTNVAAVDSLAFLIGRVGVDILTNREPRSRVADLSPHIDRPGRIVRSQTDELALDWGRGLLTVQSPAAQGITGFLRDAGRRTLPAATFESPMEYGSILLVALDGKPLTQSRRMLLQVASEDQPHQWATEPASGRRTLRNRGTGPVMVRTFAGQVRFSRPDAATLRVTPLDYNGYPTGPAAPVAAGITLAPETPYYLVSLPPVP